MSQTVTGKLFLAACILSGSLAHVLLKAALGPEAGLAGIRHALSAGPGAALRLIAAVVLLGMEFCCYLAALARLPVSLVYPLSCTSAALVCLVAWASLGEVVTPRMWLGVLLVVAGSALLAPVQ